MGKRWLYLLLRLKKTYIFKCIQKATLQSLAKTTSSLDFRSFISGPLALSGSDDLFE